MDSTEAEMAIVEPAAVFTDEHAVSPVIASAVRTANVVFAYRSISITPFASGICMCSML